MTNKDFIGTSNLFRLALKRDRIKLPIWILAISLLAFLMTAANGTLSSDEMIQMAQTAIDNPGMRLMVAPTAIEILDHLGAFILFRMSFILAIVLALMNSQLIIRHTRQNEETGRSELIASTVTGKRAPLTAALSLAVMTNLCITLGLGLGFLANGFETSGSFVAAISYGLYGMLFASIAAVTSELSSSSKGANSMATLMLAAAFLINGSGNAIDFGEHALTWFSPIGWVQHVRPYDLNRLFPLLLLLLASFIFMMIANGIIKRRDVGTGVLPARMGRADAKAWYIKPFGFAIKLQRPLFIGWLIPIFLFGIIFGAAGQGYGDTLQDSDLLKDVLQGIQNSFIYMMIGVMSMIVCFYTLQSLLRSRYEEVKGYTEGILATPTKKSTYLISHMSCSLFGSVLLVLAFVSALMLSVGDVDSFAPFVKYALQNASAIILIFGISTFFHGISAKFSHLISWLIVGIFVITGPFFGAILQLSENVQNLSPFSQFGFMYSSDNWSAAFAYYALGTTLALLGIRQYKRRDLKTQ